MYAHIHLYVYLHTRTHIYIRIQVEEAVDRRAVTVELSEFAAMNLSEFAAKKTPIFFGKIGVVFQGVPSCSGLYVREPPKKENPPGGGRVLSINSHTRKYTYTQGCNFIYAHTHTHTRVYTYTGGGSDG